MQLLQQGLSPALALPALICCMRACVFLSSFPLLTLKLPPVLLILTSLLLTPTGNCNSGDLRGNAALGAVSTALPPVCFFFAGLLAPSVTSQRAGIRGEGGGRRTFVSRQRHNTTHGWFFFLVRNKFFFPTRRLRGRRM